MFITRFNWVDDEVCEILVEDKKVFEANHDDHGWEGMRGIISAVTYVTQAAGGVTIVTGRPGV